MKKSSSLSELEKKRDKYLFKKYGVTLNWYNNTLSEQNGGCAICDSKPITRNLPVDHDHKTPNKKLNPFKNADKLWEIKVTNTCTVYSDKKNTAIREARWHLKRESVRGVICFGCNTGIRKFRDNPEYLKRAAQYVEEYKSKFNA